jgi:hypothetical protein
VTIRRGDVTARIPGSAGADTAPLTGQSADIVDQCVDGGAEYGFSCT